MRLMRLKVSSVSFDFLIVSSILLAFSAKAVKIGVMVNPYLPTRREQEVAIRIAAQHFNSSSPLVLRFNETNDDPVQTSTTAKDMVDWGAEVLIGIGTWPEVVTLARVGNTSGVPILSLAEQTTGSNLLSTMPFLVQMSYPTSDEVLCLANIISSYNWRRVIVIYEDDIYGSISSIATLFSDALQAHGSKIDHHIVFPSTHTVPNVAELVREKLQNIPPQLSKVFVVLRSSPQLANSLFMEAKEHNLMAADHVWIVSDDITDLLDSNFSQSFISSYMQGVIGIRTYFNQTTTFYQNFSIDFQKNLSNNNIEPRRLAVRAYDAIHVIANAVAARERNRNQNITLWEGILASNFLGLSGSINFSTIGANYLPQVRGFSAFRVLNVAGKSYKEIGYWSKGYGFYEDEEEMSQFGSRVVPMLRPILWPGHMGKIPKIPGGWGKLKIGVPNHTTFEKFVKVEYDDSGMVKEPQGFCIQVFKEILKNLNYDVLYEWAPFNGSYDDLVNQVSLKKFDVAVGDITILAKRSVNVTFTEPFLSSGLSMLVPIRTNHTPWMLTKPFTKEVWFLFLATLIYTCVVVWYLERKNNPELNGNWRQQLGAALWLTFSTLFFAHGRVYSFYTKTVIIVWLLVVLILINSFTANLSSILTIEKIEPAPAGSKVGYNGDYFAFKYLQNVLNFKAQNLIRITKSEAYDDAFRSGNISAAYLETPYLRVFLSRYDKYTVIGETHALGGFGFVFPKDSPLAGDFSEIILKLTEDGTFKKLEQDEFSFTLSNTPSPDKERRRDSLSIESFWALFVFTGSISTTMLILFTRHLIVQNGRRLSNVLFGSMRRSFKTVWTMTKKRKREQEEKVFPISSQEGTIHGQNEITIDINLPRNHVDDDNI
ncbi:glutamate receptor 2.7-like [Curcuma longa]|uniref:glutamate receptor 2.7-like n=1 Tax=Curcuma longa TaxID=136217 RepID=UPI003D9F258A